MDKVAYIVRSQEDIHSAEKLIGKGRLRTSFEKMKYVDNRDVAICYYEERGVEWSEANWYEKKGYEIRELICSPASTFFRSANAFAKQTGA